MVGVILVLCSGPSSLAIILLWNEELVALLVVGTFVWRHGLVCDYGISWSHKFLYFHICSITIVLFCLLVVEMVRKMMIQCTKQHILLLLCYKIPLVVMRFKNIQHTLHYFDKP